MVFFNRYKQPQSIFSLTSLLNFLDHGFDTSKKGEEVYERFYGEVVVPGPSIANIQKVGYDLDKSIAKCAWVYSLTRFCRIHFFYLLVSVQLAAVFLSYKTEVRCSRVAVFEGA